MELIDIFTGESEPQRDVYDGDRMRRARWGLAGTVFRGGCSGFVHYLWRKVALRTSLVIFFSVAAGGGEGPRAKGIQESKRETDDALGGKSASRIGES